MNRQGSVERRRGRRASVEAPLLIRRTGAQGSASTEEVTKNVSLAGVYFETEEGHPYADNEIVMASVSIPESSVREFPFTRLAGRGRVVRIDEVREQEPSRPKRFGIALEFGHDLTALSAIPARG